MSHIQNKILTSQFEGQMFKNKMTKENIFEILKISDYACTGAALFVVIFSLMGDYYEYQNKKSVDRFVFNFGFITLCTSLGTIFGAALGVTMTGTPTAFGLGCLIGSYLGLRLKNKINVR